jgi:hypothetical protein
MAALCYNWRMVLTAEVVLLLLLLAFAGCSNATMTDGAASEPLPLSPTRSCERLKGSLTYTQQDAPDDVSLVVRLYVDQCVRTVVEFSNVAIIRTCPWGIDLCAMGILSLPLCFLSI